MSLSTPTGCNGQACFVIEKAPDTYTTNAKAMR